MGEDAQLESEKGPFPNSKIEHSHVDHLLNKDVLMMETRFLPKKHW